MIIAPRPLTLLIAAMGGEGGGVLTNWIVNAARSEGLAVQSTSIPGVAQRTGATTYYVEIHPLPATRLGARRPVFSLVPSAGDLDVMVASELLEAGRAIGNGFVSADRTVLIASTHRVFAMTERTAMGDGRFDTGRLLRAIEENARRAILFDMEEAAREAKSVLNAVLLGAIAGAGVLPIAPETFAAGIRAEGKDVEANLRGFEAGLAYARGELSALGGGAPAGAGKRPTGPVVGIEDLIDRARAEFPSAVAETAIEGVRRLARYQDPAYAKLYLDRLSRIAAVERSLGGESGRLARETARHLAVRMSYEDVIRVAQQKTDPERIARIEREAAARPGEPVAIVDFLKPGIEEICSVLPPRLAERILAVSRRRGWLDRFHLGMRVRSNGVTGYLRLRLVAALRRWRPRTHRFAEEQRAIEAWLERLVASARLSPDLALETADCARLVKGYGDTHRRGRGNFERIMAELVDPALQGRLPADFAADAVASARTAALADPEGGALDRTLADIRSRAPVPRAAE
jgi:indolepyruvate ferredoxin oxidoreductase, beta subunit